MKKNIVILSAFLTPFRSGAEACVEEIAVELSDEFNITIITARLKRSSPRRDSLKGKVSVLRVGFGCRADKWFYPFLASRAAKKMKPDIIHAILESYAGFALMLCGREFRRILTCQSTNTSLLVKAMHRSADTVTVISNALKARAEKFGRKDAILIPNGLHLRDVPQKEKIVGRILFAGRLEKMKGIDTLIEAIKDLPPHVHLHIAGDGSLRSDLQVKANLLGVGDRVKFLGYVQIPNVYEEFARAEIFCGLSRHEAFGNVFIEAQAAGCAVVATNIEGIPDIVQDGKTGILVSPDDPAAAARALSTLLEDGDLRKKFAEAGIRNAQKYDWAEIAQKYAALYRA